MSKQLRISQYEVLEKELEGRVYHQAKPVQVRKFDLCRST